MEKIEIGGHPSTMFIRCDKNPNLVILGGYDGGYPRIIYASAPNLLGGNPEQADKVRGPYDVLKREVEEEISRGSNDKDWKGRPIQWANDADIKLIRDSILENTSSYGDYLVVQDGIMGKRRDTNEKVRLGDLGTYINSVYKASIGQDVLECIQDNINAGKRFYTEGFVGIHNMKQLEAAGEFSTAHATAPILNYYFGTNIPSPPEIKVSKVGNVRQLYSHYSEDFPHAESVWGAK
ncbi:MAG: hypothetical protein Q7S27_06625 [Nanoarchaeota archaeon]|nr:hypothetical protein [Nanoarchaeota archaeon]